MSGGSKLTNKQAHALSMMQANPLGWLRHGPMEVRDLALINAHAVPFVKYGSQSFVRKLVRIRAYHAAVLRFCGSSVPKLTQLL